MGKILQTPMATQSTEEFIRVVEGEKYLPNMNMALAYLRNLGIKITQPKFYLMVTNGLRKHLYGYKVEEVLYHAEKIVSQEEEERRKKMEAKASKRKRKPKPKKPQKVEEDPKVKELKEQKLDLQIKLLRQRLTMQREQVKILKSKYVPKTQVEMELAQRALMFKKTLNNVIKTYGNLIVETVQGRVEKLKDLQILWEGIVLEILQQYTKPQTETD